MAQNRFNATKTCEYIETSQKRILMPATALPKSLSAKTLFLKIGFLKFQGKIGFKPYVSVMGTPQKRKQTIKPRSAKMWEVHMYPKAFFNSGKRRSKYRAIPLKKKPNRQTLTKFWLK